MEGKEIKMNRCLDCKTEVRSDVLRCRSCYRIWSSKPENNPQYGKKGPDHPAYKGERHISNYCKCGRRIHIDSGMCKYCNWKRSKPWLIGNKNSPKMFGRDNPSKRPEVRKKISQKSLDRIQNHPGPYKDTKPELKMKEIFNKLNIPFEHQVKVEGINHIFDFRISGTGILIEVDGEWPHKLPDRRLKDYKINREVKKLGYVVIRFWGKDTMKNEEKVIKRLGEFYDREKR